LDRAAGSRPVRRNGKARIAGIPDAAGDLQGLNAVWQPGGAESGTFRALRHPVDGSVRLARDAGAATASPGGRLRAAEN